MRRLAVLSLHTSPLAQPGTGDGGGMNVYVRELAAALARSGVTCDVFTRAWSPDLPAVVTVEPGLRVHHVPAGPLEEVPKEALPALVDEFTAEVLARMTAPSRSGGRRGRRGAPVHVGPRQLLAFGARRATPSSTNSRCRSSVPSTRSTA